MHCAWARATLLSISFILTLADVRYYNVHVTHATFRKQISKVSEINISDYCVTSVFMQETRSLFTYIAIRISL